mmetsp:Transcript_59927/g.128617  ORF Transcript_59927/g.128617 Transcript_59927/m.128617 type:complete len:431 (-) Transcript_59927:213-1505(-)
MPSRHADLAPGSDDSSDEDEESADEDPNLKRGKHGRKQRSSGLGFTGKVCICCCTGCTACGLALVIVLVLLALNLNPWVAAAIETVGSTLLGVDVSVDSLNIGLIEGRAAISGFSVASPPGFQGPLFDLGEAVFDIGPASVLAVAILDKPFELEQLSASNLNVFIDQPTSTSNNALTAVQHANGVTKALAPQLGTPTQAPINEETESKALTAMETKIRAGRIEFSNITASVCIQPICGTTGPLNFTLTEILIENVGKEGGGVHLYELLEIIVIAIMQSVIQAAPDQIRLNLLNALGNTLNKVLNCGSIGFDITGNGLAQVVEWNAWATKQLTVLPLRIAAEQAKLAEAQAKLNFKAAQEAAKLNLQATQEATKLNMHAASLGVEATAEAAKMGTKAVGLGVQASTAATKIGTGFTNMGTKITSGFISGFR